MKEFMKMMEKDLTSENFSKREVVIYGIIVPVMMIVIMGIAGWIETF